MHVYFYITDDTSCFFQLYICMDRRYNIVPQKNLQILSAKLTYVIGIIEMYRFGNGAFLFLEDLI